MGRETCSKVLELDLGSEFSDSTINCKSDYFTSYRPPPRNPVTCSVSKSTKNETIFHRLYFSHKKTLCLDILDLSGKKGNT